MTENCILEPGRECPNSLRLTLLENRVHDLEEVEGKQEEFRKNYYQEKERRIESDAKLKAKIDNMDEKLDKVVEWQEAQKAKPGQRWESVGMDILKTIIGVVIGLLAAKMGLV